MLAYQMWSVGILQILEIEILLIMIDTLDHWNTTNEKLLKI